MPALLFAQAGRDGGRQEDDVRSELPRPGVDRYSDREFDHGTDMLNEVREMGRDQAIVQAGQATHAIPSNEAIRPSADGSSMGGMYQGMEDIARQSYEEKKEAHRARADANRQRTEAAAAAVSSTKEEIEAKADDAQDGFTGNVVHNNIQVMAYPGNSTNN